MVKTSIKAHGKYFREQEGNIYQVANRQVKKYFLFGILLKTIEIEDINDYNSEKDLDYNENNFNDLSRVEKSTKEKNSNTPIGFATTL